MKFRLVQSTVFVATTLAGTHALAHPSASASLTNMKIELIDIAPNDGILPSVDFAFAPYSRFVSVGAFGAAPGNDFYKELDTPGTDPNPISVVSPPNRFNKGSASISGGFPASAWSQQATATPFVPPQASQQQSWQADSYAQFYCEPTSFVLSPGTIMVITGSASLSTTVDRKTEQTLGLREFADATLSIGLRQVQSDPNQQDSELSLALSSSMNPWAGIGEPSDSQEVPVSLSFVNQTQADLGGYFWSQVHVNASGWLPAIGKASEIAAVPEPGSLGLLCAGLGFCGLLARRSRHGSESTHVALANVR